MGEKIAFLLLSGMTLLLASAVVSLRNVFHAALALAAALVGVAGLYVLLHAEFLAAVQVLIYAAGVVALILFAVVLSHRITGRHLPQTSEQKWLAGPVCFALFLLLARVIHSVPFPVRSEAPVNVLDTVGKSLLTRFLLPFELASLILLVAVIGGICFVKRESE